MKKNKLYAKNYWIGLLVFTLLSCENQAGETQNWTHRVRIAGHSLNHDAVDSIISGANGSHVFGIEVDNDIPGRYESFLNPAEKLEAIRLVSQKAHESGNFTFVYIAGLECITDQADQKTNTFFKDHPDWVQRDMNGRPAIFGGDDAFWIREGDEDVWISPYAAEWRRLYMQRVREIAATGVDGIYVDIPYWMTHFDGWEDTWASFDDYTVAAFKSRSNIDAKKDIRLGDMSDPGFRQWVDFRIETITAFMKDIDENVKAVNPACKTIAEIYPGLGEDAVRVGSDVYQLYDVVDAIGHEYSEGAYMAAAREPLDWFAYMAGMYSFRAFAGQKPSWMLSYSWDGEQSVRPSEAMELLFLSQVMAGTNVWDARGHVMSGTNDIETRKKVFAWIARWESLLYSPRIPLTPVGIYFSPKSRDYFSEDYLPAYMGTMLLLLQSQMEFQIVTPRSLSAFKGPVLILPEARCLSEAEMDRLKILNKNNTKLIITGQSGQFDLSGKKTAVDIMARLSASGQTAGDETISMLADDPGAAYYAALKSGFNQAAWQGAYQGEKFDSLRSAFVDLINTVPAYQPLVTIESSPFICSQVAGVNGAVTIFLANFKGIRGLENLQPLTEKEVLINITTSAQQNVYFLPYLGEVMQLETKFDGQTLTATIAEIKSGGIVFTD